MITETSLVLAVVSRIVAAYFYSLRGLLALSRRLKRLGKDGVVDPEQIRRSIEDAVKDYNEGRLAFMEKRKPMFTGT